MATINGMKVDKTTREARRSLGKSRCTDGYKGNFNAAEAMMKDPGAFERRKEELFAQYQAKKGALDVH